MHWLPQKIGETWNFAELYQMCIFRRDWCGQVSDGGEEYLPSCLEELEGKEFVFQIRVTPFNFTPNYRTFTVSTITDEDSTIATQLKAHSEGIIPSGSGDVGLSASSSGPSVLEVKHGEKCSSAAPPENADTLKKRKRSRE
ncbi:hypothetical protein YC2023_005051 [Brassica napus]